MFGRSDHREPDAPGRQVIHIEVAAGYHPSVVRARPGEAIRLVFDRLDEADCTSRVIFSSPRMERRLAALESTPVDLPPQPAGEIRYTCGLGRYSGVIQVEELPASRLAVLQRQVRQHESSVAVAAIVAAVGLPIVVALAFVGIGAAPAIFATMLALVTLGGLGWWGVGKVGRRQAYRGSEELSSEALSASIVDARGNPRSQPDPRSQRGR